MSKTKGLWDRVAFENGYTNKFDLFMDYSIYPTVRVSSHKAIEIVPLILRHFSKGKKRP